MNNVGPSNEVLASCARAKAVLWAGLRDGVVQPPLAKGVRGCYPRKFLENLLSRSCLVVPWPPKRWRLLMWNMGQWNAKNWTCITEWNDGLPGGTQPGTVPICKPLCPVWPPLGAATERQWCDRNDGAGMWAVPLRSGPTEVDPWDRLVDRSPAPAGWEPKQRQATGRRSPRRDDGCCVVAAVQWNSETLARHGCASAGLSRRRCAGHEQRKRERLSSDRWSLVSSSW